MHILNFPSCKSYLMLFVLERRLLSSAVRGHSSSYLSVTRSRRFPSLLIFTKQPIRPKITELLAITILQNSTIQSVLPTKSERRIYLSKRTISLTFGFLRLGLSPVVDDPEWLADAVSRVADCILVISIVLAEASERSRSCTDGSWSRRSVERRYPICNLQISLLLIPFTWNKIDLTCIWTLWRNSTLKEIPKLVGNGEFHRQLEI